MKKVEFHKDTEITIKNIKGFMKRRVVVSGTSAKINVPKEYLGYETYLVILEKNGTKKRSKSSSRRIEGSKGRE
jgi:putative transposon-encoded protein